MGVFSFFKKQKQFFTAQENEQIVQAIRMAEMQTSGEIRVYVESRNPLVSTVERAAEIFYNLKMQETEHRNGVLLYLAVDDHEVALFGDEGIHQMVGSSYWEAQVTKMLELFKQNNLPTGMANCILAVGETLHEKFPYEAATDKNELPDEIVFGK